jgi:hypothetical protein
VGRDRETTRARTTSPIDEQRPRLGWQAPLGPPRTGSGSSRRLFLSLPGGLLLLSPPLDAAAVADPDSHSLLIPGPLDALAGFQASFSDALRGELHRLAAMRAGERRCRSRHAARIARLSRSTDRSEEPSLRFPDTRRVFPRTEARACWSAPWAAGDLLTPGRARSRRCWAPPAPCDLSRRHADARRANTVPRS